MHVFGRDLHFGPRFYRRNLETYLAEFSAAHGSKRGGEASVWYLFSKTAAAELKAFNPDSRIIIMLREPVEMMYSLFHEFRWDGNEQLASFEEALAAEPERSSGRMLTNRTYFAQGLVYREAARFAEQVWRYLQVFGRQRVHVVIYDDFAANPAAAYRELLRFLDVEPVQNQTGFEAINGCKSVKSRWLQRLLGDQRVRGAAIAMGRKLPKPLFRALQGAEEKIWRLNTRATQRPSLDAELRALLMAEMQPQVERLAEMLGRDLSAWSRPSRDITYGPESAKVRPNAALVIPTPEIQPG